MRKLLILAILLASTGVTSLTIEAKTIYLAETSKTIATNVISSQISVQPGNRKRNNRRRVITRSRIIRIRNHYYRETYQITYLPNGRRQIRILNRIRIR